MGRARPTVTAWHGDLSYSRPSDAHWRPQTKCDDGACVSALACSRRRGRPDINRGPATLILAPCNHPQGAVRLAEDDLTLPGRTDGPAQEVLGLRHGTSTVPASVGDRRRLAPVSAPSHCPSGRLTAVTNPRPANRDAPIRSSVANGSPARSTRTGAVPAGGTACWHCMAITACNGAETSASGTSASGCSNRSPLTTIRNVAGTGPSRCQKR
jgi:hypothetical protein